MLLAALLALALQPTALTITEYPQGGGGPKVVATLRCSPAGGTLKKPARACRQLAASSDPFARVDYLVCADIYGGPQVAHVVGRYRGRRVDRTFQRRNSCEIESWDSIRFLFPVQAHL
jgi:hypothetical protein